jgi:putative ABC transport system permease protein
MKLIDILRMALGNLKRNRMRTVLTVAGVVVGIGAIVFLVSLGYGLQSLLVSKAANLEALTVITVTPGSKEDTTITDSVVERFKGMDGISAVSPIREYISLLRDGENSSSPVLYGIRPEYFDFEDIKIEKGEKFSSDKAKEVILSEDSIRALKLEPEKVLGQEISFEGVQQQDGGDKNGDAKIKLKVVGTITEKNGYAPLETLKELGSEKYSTVRVKVEDRNEVKNVRKTIESMGFPTTNSAGDQVEQIDQAFVIIRSVLGGFGLISLFVAAIGIFNTMTISLLERTHEIGIMKSIGGRSRDVALIFTTEAAVIGLWGGILGVFSGWLLGEGINGLMNFIAVNVGGEKSDVFYTPLDFAGVVVLFSFIISTIAGIWPARRASKLNPLEALRYE